MEIAIRGRDWDDARPQASKEIIERLRELRPGDRRRQRLPGGHARGAGLPRPQQVRGPRDLHGRPSATTINSAIGGERVGKFKDLGRRFDIRVRLLAPQRERPEDIARLLVRTGSGDLVRLGDIVRIEQRPTLQAITRKDRERAITVFANVAPGVSQADAIDELAGRPPDRRCPTATAPSPPGAARRSRSRSSRWPSPSVLGLLVAYMVLATQFNAFTPPVHRAPGAALQRQRGAPHPVGGGPEPERLQHARHHPADGDREEELDPARGLHQPDPRAGGRSSTRRCCAPAPSACGRS